MFALSTTHPMKFNRRIPRTPGHGLRRLGDPATASSIFLTTATDVISMGLLLGLATLIIR